MRLLLPLLVLLPTISASSIYAITPFDRAIIILDVEIESLYIVIG